MEQITLGTDTTTNEPVSITQKALLQGTYVLGLQGFGKTGLFENMMGQLIAQGAGLAFIDPHGEPTEHILALIPEARKRDVVLLDIHDTQRPFGLNLFECTNAHDDVAVALALDQVVQTFKKEWADSWGPQLEDVLRNLTHLLLANPSYTMAEIPKILTDDAFRAGLLRNLTNVFSRQFWEHEYGCRYAGGQLQMRESSGN